MTKRARVIDGLAWPPVTSERIASYSAELLRDCLKIESNRNGGKRGMRGCDGVDLSADQIRIIAATMLNACCKRAAPPPVELVQLVAHLLTGTTADNLLRELQVSRGTKSVLPDDPRFFQAINFEWNNPGSSARAVALAAGVAPNTVTAWRKHPAYARELRMIEVAQKEGLR